MTEVRSRGAPQLSPIQIAWLRELGIDRRLLTRFNVQAAALQDRAPAQASGPMPDRAADAEIVVQAARPLPPDMAALEAAVAVCEACPLYSGRSQPVFGSGATQSVSWMVVGEAPGDQDDRAGLPFQGRAGTLLQAMLGAVGVEPDASVYFTNLVKCRPLGNRIPEPAEVAACLPYLQRQIALLQPRRILALGRLAAQALLGSEAELEQLRGRVHHFRSESGADIPLVATYHPAFLLSRPQHKIDAWRDLNLARGA